MMLPAINPGPQVVETLTILQPISLGLDPVSKLRTSGRRTPGPRAPVIVMLPAIRPGLEVRGTAEDLFGDSSWISNPRSVAPLT
jgi:hypothetical protein